MINVMQVMINSWESFIPEFAQNVLPVYEAHEHSFDLTGLHSRQHITRCVIFTELLLRFYAKLGISPLDEEAIRIATAFHDSGRQANGTDRWEAESAENCTAYLLGQGKPQAYALQVARTIVEKDTHHSHLATQILYDVDVLDIMRLLVNDQKGIDRFRRKELMFLSPNDVQYYQVMHYTGKREAFIREVWNYVFETEWMNASLDNQTFLPFYLSVFTQNKQKYPWMNRFFSFEV